MSGRKGLLAFMCGVYILAAFGAIAVFFIIPDGASQSVVAGEEMPGPNTSAAMLQTTTNAQTSAAQQTSAAEQQTMSAARQTTSAAEQPNTSAAMLQTETNAQTSAAKQTTSATEQQQTSAAELQMSGHEDTHNSSEAAEDSPLLAGAYDVIGYAVSYKGSVRIRKAPDNSGALAGWIPEGGRCEVLLDNVQGWMLVRYEGYTGFVYGGNLRMAEAADAP